MTEQDLDAIQEQVEAAASGLVEKMEGQAPAIRIVSARLIAHARQDVPALVTECRALMGAFRDRLQDEAVLAEAYRKGEEDMRQRIMEALAIVLDNPAYREARERLVQVVADFDTTEAATV